MTQWGVDTLFNPAKRHMDEEKRRLQSTRQEVGDNSGGRRIDLASGKVTISRPPAEQESGEDPADAEALDAEALDAEAVDAAEDTAADRADEADQADEADEADEADRPAGD